MILDLIEKDRHITQREISKTIGVAVSMVNQYLDNYQKKGLIKKEKHSTKTVEYFVTKKGVERRKVLNISYLYASQILYNSAKENIEKFLEQIKDRGFKNIILYGAGEVAELLLYTIKSSKIVLINVLAVIDDDLNKIGQQIVGVNIISKNKIGDFLHDGILISSYTNRLQMINNLLMQDYNKLKIIQFFD